MEAMILVGGRGTRLEPLTDTRPKPLVALLEAPILESIIQHLKNDGVDRMTLLTGYHGDDLRQYVGSGSRWGLAVQYLQERSPLGTAGSVIRALDLMPRHEPFLVVSGDGLTNVSVAQFYRQCQDQKAHAAILLAQSAEPQRYGVVHTDIYGYVRSFEEKPTEAPAPAWINTGIYYIDPRQLANLPHHVPLDFGREVFPRWVAEHRPFFGIQSLGYWTDIGTITSYHQAIDDILDQTVSLAGISRHPANAESRLGPSAMPTVYIDPTAYVSGRAHIGPYSIIGPHAYIGDRAQIEHSIVRAHTRIEAGASLQNAIVAEHCLVSDNATLSPGTVIGEGCHVGPSVHLPPGTHLSAFTTCVTFDGMSPQEMDADGAARRMSISAPGFHSIQSA
jgi:mannose-1-phosphate guanylyltransferase/phosphomannomutase